MEKKPTPLNPDFDRFAGDFDKYLPLIAPVGEAILKRLPPLKEGDMVLDVACGTGEPGLSLARKQKNVRIVGIDAVDNMIRIARQKSEQEGLKNIEFRTLKVEDLNLESETVVAAISRFGLAMFGDADSGARQIARVLCPKGRFSIAVWHDMTKNTLVHTITEVLQALLPSESMASFSSAPGAHAKESFINAGFVDIQEDEFHWDYQFANKDELEAFIRGVGTFMFESFFKLLQERGELALEMTVEKLRPYEQASGAYAIPHTCNLIWGSKR
jgi:ubiquinone/menaquinone biosynthesis C-methylase UbiE